MFNASLMDDEEIQALLNAPSAGVPEAPSAPAQTLSDLYGPDLTDERLKEIQDKKASTKNTIGDVLAGLGDAISAGYGRGSTDTLGSNIKARNDAKKQAVQDFILRRKEKTDQAKFGQEQEKFGMDKETFKTDQTLKGFQVNKAERGEAQEIEEDAAFNDPASPQTAIARKLAKKMVPGIDWENSNGKFIFQQIPSLEKLYKIEQDNEQKRIDREFRAEAAKDKGEDKKIKRSSDLSNTLYKRTQFGVLGDLNRMRTMANTAQGNIKKFAEDPSGYSDYGTLMTSLKSLQGDTSVVKEAEIKLGTNATSLINKALNSIQRGIDGKSLQPEQRQQIIQVMGALTEGYEGAYRKAAAPTVAIAKKEGIPLEEIFDDPRGVEIQENPSNLKPVSEMSDEEMKKELGL